MKSRVSYRYRSTVAYQAGLTAVLLAIAVSNVAAAPADALTKRHDEGVQYFRAGRFSAAYGRFVELAEVGHKPAAQYALWMCQHGLELFGKDWDCNGDQLEDWSLLAGVPTPALHARHYGHATLGPVRQVGAVKVTRRLPSRVGAMNSRPDSNGR